MDPKFFEDIAKKLNEAVPPGLKELKNDLEKNFKNILQSGFSKLDLVTREEFDVQVRVLARTRAKLTELEKQLGQLEAHQKSGKHNKDK